MRGWLEGRPTPEQIATRTASLRQARRTWHPTPQAWDQFVQMQRFAGTRVRVRFWDVYMAVLDESEWPDWIEARCEGTATLIEHGHLQAFMMLRDPINARTRERPASTQLLERGAINCKLAPLAHLYEIEAVEVAA